MISSDNAVLFSYALWLIGRVHYRVPLDRLREVIARWFFMAHTTGRYTGAFESRFEQDAGRLTDLAAGDADGYVRVLSTVVNDTLTADYWAITLPNELATSASKSPALLAYIAALNILDADALLSTGKVRSRLDPAITARKGIERHHIFPRAYLKKRLGITDSKEINQIANMALVEWADNIAISDEDPAVYWPAQVAAKQITPDRLTEQRYWHALPDGWEQMEFADFLSRRRRLMADVVRDAFTRLNDSGYQPTYPEVTPPAAEPATRTWTAYGVRAVDLIDAELLPVGTQLVSTLTTMDALATVLHDGKIAYEDEVYDTPSGPPWPPEQFGQRVDLLGRGHAGRPVHPRRAPGPLPATAQLVRRLLDERVGGAATASRGLAPLCASLAGIGFRDPAVLDMLEELPGPP
jgi:hypothetical protein